MKFSLTLTLIPLLTAAVLAAESTPLNQVKAAAHALADQKNYAWVSTPRSEGGTANWRQGPTYGQTEKDGFTYFKFELGDNTIEAAFRGDKRAIKMEYDWVASTELEGDQAWIAERLKAYRAPAGEAEQLVDATTKLEKQPDGSFSGSLTPEKVTDLLLMGRRTNTQPKDLKGSARFWIKEGLLSKYEYNLQGKVTGRDEQEVQVNRTTTVEVKDIGVTKVQVPEQGKKKL
jgi:hypothetical protein